MVVFHPMADFLIDECVQAGFQKSDISSRPLTEKEIENRFPRKMPNVDAKIILLRAKK